MKKILTLSAAMLCLSLGTMSHIPAKAAPKSAAVSDWVRSTSWQIAYFPNLNMVTLSWPSFSMPGLGPQSFTFNGTMQYIVPTATTSIYWTGIATLSTGTTYTMNIAGVTYYFQIPSSPSGGICTITGHS